MGYSAVRFLALGGILGFLVAIPPAEALPGPAVGDCQAYRHEAVVAIAAVIAAGDNQVWAAMPGCGVARSSSQAFTFVGQYSGPVFLAAATIVWQVVPFVGCTISSFTTQNNLGLGGSSSITVATITMTSNECRGAVQVTVSVGGGAYTWPALFEINIRVEQAPVLFLCGATEGAVNSFTPAQTCADPTLNVAQSGTWTMTIAGDIAVDLDPLTGTVAITGIPDTQEEIQAVADAITTLNRLRVQVCGSDGDVEAGDCMAWDQTANLTVGNQTNNVVVPDETTVHNCGPPNPANESECTPVVASAGLRLSGNEGDGFSFDGLLLDGSLLLLLWFVALIWCLRRAKLFAAIASTIAIFCVFIPGPEWIGWVGVLIFVLALWLEAVARDKLPYHWFKGSNSTTRSVE